MFHRRRLRGTLGARGTSSASAMSLVLTAASSQYLTRTWGASPTNNQIFTIAFFVKRLSVQSANADIYDGGIWNGGTSASHVSFNGSNLIEYSLFDGSSVIVDEIPLGAFGDTTTWHHVCYAFDSSQGSATARRTIYVDGSVINPDSVDTFPPLNQNFHMTDNGLASAIGRYQGGANRYVDAKLAYFYFIDGQQLSAASFTSGSGAGTTHPATYSGSYGTNGFFLNFFNSATTDQSGNGNSWTQVNTPTFSTDLPS